MFAQLCLKRVSCNCNYNQCSGAEPEFAGTVDFLAPLDPEIFRTDPVPDPDLWFAKNANSVSKILSIVKKIYQISLKNSMPLQIIQLSAISETFAKKIADVNRLDRYR
jgi:hypothetical protein